jgi:alanyl-tRNA synthetase
VQEDLATIYGPFAAYPSFKRIIALEYKRWRFTDDATKQKLQKHLKKTGGKLSTSPSIHPSY